MVRCQPLLDNKAEVVIRKVEKGVVGLKPPHRKGKRHKVDVAKIFDNQSCRERKIAEVLLKRTFYGCLFGSVQLEEFLQSDRRTRMAWHKDKHSVIRKVAAQSQVHARNYVGNRSEGKGTFYGFREKDGKRHLKGHNNHGFCSPKTMIDRTIHHLERSSNHSSPFFQLADDIISQSVNADNKFYKLSQKMDAHLVLETTGDWSCANHCSASSCSSNDLGDSQARNCNADSEDKIDNTNFQALYPTLSCDFGRNLVDQIHELEFRAYRSTLQALYASGPLSWEQESLLTNLRISLHISDEEHLLQLRRLLSTHVM